MDVVALVLAVACVLLVLAGVGKLTQPRPTTVALAALGRSVPQNAVRAFGAFEVVVGVATIASGTAVGALAVAAIYLGFTVFVLAAVQRGLASCACFGEAGGAPSWAHAGLNIALAASALAAGVGGAPSAREVVADHPVALLPVAAGVVACYLILSHERDAAPLATGGVADVADIDLASGRTALVFLSTTCLTCREIWRALGSVPSPLPGDVRPVVVTKDEEPTAKVRELAPPGVTTVQDSDAWERYGVSVAPAVVLVDCGEVVTAGLAASWDEVIALATA